MGDRIFSGDYYKECQSNMKKRRNKWFCNRDLSPKAEFSLKSNGLHDTVPTASVKCDENLDSNLFGEDLPDPESDVDDIEADPEYNPSLSSSTDESSSGSESYVCNEIKEDKAKKIEIYSSPEVPSSDNMSNDNEISESLTNEEVIERNKTINRGANRKRHQNMCYFCESLVTNFSRHVARNHSSEIEVQRMLSYSAGSKKRKELLSVLRKRGNFLGNSEDGKPVRNGTENTSYLPCTHCLGFYSSKNLWRHRKECNENPNAGTSAIGSKVDAQNLLIQHLKIDPQLKETVFPHMRADKISLVAKKDKLICSFATRYLKIHREKHFISVATRKMRELAKLLIEMKRLEPSIKNFFHVLKPQNFDNIVKATKTVAKYSEDKKIYEAPTYAMNMGTSLKQCCDIALMFVLKRKDVYATIPAAEAEADLKTLTQLIEAHWKYEISSQANNDLNLNKWNKITLIPLATDLKLLKEYLIETANTSLALLDKRNRDCRAYTTLLETIFCRVILLNRRRPGELQRLLLHTYEQSLQQENLQVYEEFSEAISETERMLMKCFKRLIIRGKRGRGVPVLFSKDIQDHIMIILKYRNGIITKQNPYLFGNPNSNQPIIGYKILKKYAIKCGAKNPEAITCTRLRKHLATLTQLFSMSENDMEQLASFMGHTLSVHRSSYRLPDDVYQTAKISKLLLLMEKGQAGEFKSKTLEDIHIDLGEDLVETLEHTTEKIFEESEKIIDGDILEKEHNIEEDIQCANIKSKTKKIILIPWTEHQKKVVEIFFKQHIKSKKPPKKQECETLINAHPDLLKNKDWLKIKVFVQNKYTNKSK